MRKSNGDPKFEYLENIKDNEVFSFHFSHNCRIRMRDDNKEEILAAAKKLYGGGIQRFEKQLEL